MDSSDKWEKIKELGEGVQGKVYLVVKKSEFFYETLFTEIKDSIKNISNKHTTDTKTLRDYYEKFRKAVIKIIRMWN